MQITINLVDALSKCSDDEQATLAALLSTLHFAKVYRFPFPTAEHVANLVSEAKKELLNSSSQHRMRLVITEITRRLDLPDSASEEEISAWLLWKAAEKYGLETALPPLTLAREVLRRGIIDLLKNYLEAYEKADEAKRKEMQGHLEAALQAAPSQLVENLKQMTSVEKLTSDAMLRLMKQAVAGGGAMFFVNSLGFSAYIALSTIIHTVFTTILGITLPFAVYATASSLLSILTGPVGWLLLGTIFAGMVTLHGGRLNRDLLHIAALTALVQWYQGLQDMQDSERVRAVVSAPPQEALPAPLRNQAKEMETLHDSLGRAEQETMRLQNQIEDVLRKVAQQERQAFRAIQKENEMQMRVQSLQNTLGQAEERRERLREELGCVGQEDLLKRQQYEVIGEEMSRLEQELQTAVQLWKEVERQRLEAEEALQVAVESAKHQILDLHVQRSQHEQEAKTLREQLQALRAQRKEDYRNRFQTLMSYLRFDEEALDWFASQTDENLLLAAERVLLDMNYSISPPTWRRAEGTNTNEVCFTGDYAIYFTTEGNIKRVKTVKRRTNQLQRFR